MSRKPKRQRPGMPPAGVCVEVAQRQLRNFHAAAADVDRRPDEKTAVLLDRLLVALALYIGCERADLRLDHDPMLRTRAYDPSIKKVADRYSPHAHDPECLRYRPQPPEFAGSHHVKTNVRGEHGQYSDVVLAKRERRRERRTAEAKGDAPRRFVRPKKKWASRPFPKGRGFQKRP